MLVMMGMSSMLLRVLFSRRPSALRNFCLEKKKKEKTVFDTRCRCEKCVEKRKKDKDLVLNSLVEERKNNEVTSANKTSIELQTLKNRKTKSDGLCHQQQDEIILKVPNQR